MFFRNSVRRKSIFGALLKSISIPHFQRFVRRNSLFRSFLQTGVFLNELFWELVCKEKTGFLGYFLKLSDCLLRWCGQVGFVVPTNPTNPASPSGRLDLLLNSEQCSLPNVYPMSFLWRTCGRLVEDLHCSSLMIFVMSHSLQSVCPANFKKESDYFLFSREKIKELILLKWSEIRKLSARQDLLWSSFLTMSFFSKRGKKTC